MLGSDLLTSAGHQALALLKSDAHIIANTHEMMTGAFVRDRNAGLPTEQMHERLLAAVPAGHCRLADATAMARHLLGDTIGANMFLLGAAWQHGLIPLSEAAIVQAIRLNNVAVELNLAAFGWGRAFVVDPGSLKIEAGTSLETETPEAVIEDRTARLALYQNARYAASYRDFVAKVSDADYDPSRRLTMAVAKNLYKLMAYKDEYEVARQLTSPDFRRSLAEQFEGEYRLVHHLAPPFLGGFDAATGRPRKRRFGQWVRPILTLLAYGKHLRGTIVDPFGFSDERQMERALITDYWSMMREMTACLDDKNYDLAVELAETPDQIRGFGPVKMDAVKKVRVRQKTILESRTYSGSAPKAQ